MKAIILAAGRGSRMKSLTLDNPKCLVKFQGRSLLDWQLEAIRKSGIREIALVTGYKNQMFKKYKLKEFHNNSWKISQMFFSLSKAAKWLETDRCLISYSDIIYEKSAITELIKSTADISISYDENWESLWKRRFQDPLDDAETFNFNNENYLTEIGEKTKNINEINGQYMGLILTSPLGWKNIQDVTKNLSKNQILNLDMTALFRLFLIEKKYKIRVIPYKGKWGEIDHESDLILYEKLLRFS